MTYDEVIDAINSGAGKRYVGISLEKTREFFSYYEICLSEESSEEEEDVWISIFYQGGLLFSSSGEEDCFDIESIPKEAKALVYYPSDTFPDISGAMSEYALSEIFPSLPNPDGLWTNKDRRDFYKSALDLFFNVWNGGKYAIAG